MRAPRKQFVFNFDLADTRSGLAQGSILGAFLVLADLNELHFAGKYCEVHHFADDTNLMESQASPKTIKETATGGVLRKSCS